MLFYAVLFLLERQETQNKRRVPDKQAENDFPMTLPLFVTFVCSCRSYTSFSKVRKAYFFTRWLCFGFVFNSRRAFSHSHYKFLAKLTGIRVVICLKVSHSEN